MCLRTCLSHRCHSTLCRLFFCSPARLKFKQEDSWCWMVQSWSLTAFILQTRAYEAMNDYYKSLLYSQPPQFLPACLLSQICHCIFVFTSLISSAQMACSKILLLLFLTISINHILQAAYYSILCAKILGYLHNPIAGLSGLGHFAGWFPLTLTQLLITYVSNETLWGVLLLENNQWLSGPVWRRITQEFNIFL